MSLLFLITSATIPIILGNQISNKASLELLVNAVQGNVCLGDSRLYSSGANALIHYDCTKYLSNTDVVTVRIKHYSPDPQTVKGARFAIQKLS